MESVRLLGDVIPLGLAAAVTPTLIGLQLLVVCGPHWRRRALAVFGANAVVFVGFTLLVLGGLAQLPDRGTGHMGPIDIWLRLGCGVLLIVMSVFFLVPHPRLAAASQAMIERRTNAASPWVFLGLAAWFSATDLSSFVVMFPALHSVTVSSAADVVQGVAIVVLLVLALLPTWLPPALRLVAGAEVDPVLNRVYAWVMSHQFPLVGAVCILAGAYLIITTMLRA